LRHNGFVMTLHLTTDQLADILFQRPGRVTEGILEERSAFEKLSDRLIWEDHRLSRPYKENPIRRWAAKHMLVFDEHAQAKENPRSLRHAILELKALGFSYEQLNKFRYLSKQFMLGLDPSPILEKTKKYFGEREKMIWEKGSLDSYWSYSWSDKSVLGAAIICVENDQKRVVSTHFFPGELEEEAYALLKENIRVRHERQPDKVPLIPACARHVPKGLEA